MWNLRAAVIVLAGLCSGAIAHAQCPELTRLRTEAAVASKPTIGVPTGNRCEAYTRLSMAWNDVAQYASDHREACDVSLSMLNDIEKHHREAVKARDNVCTGRPVRPYPPDIILR